MKKISVNRLIYFMFIFFLPFTGVLKFEFIPITIRSYLFQQSSNYFMLLGLIVYILTKQMVIPKCSDLDNIVKLYVYTVIHSVVMAIILYLPLGILHNESTLHTISGNIIFYLIVVLCIYYNYVMLKEYVNINELFKIFDIQIIILLIVGYLQLLAIWVGGVFRNVYSQIVPILNLLPIEKLNRGVCFFGSEPSSASILSYIVIPYLLAKLLMKNEKKIGALFRLLLFLPLLFSSTSSSLLITLVLLGTAFIALITNNKIVFRIVVISAFLIGASIAVMYGMDIFVNTSVADEQLLKYMVFGKIIDRTNMSTMARSSTIINDMRVFFKYPLTGVGNGIQGFFYNENMPKWAMLSYEVQNWMAGKNGVVGGGGSFFCTYISSYGLIGCVAAIPVVRQFVSYIHNMQYNNEIVHKMFCMFIIMFLASCWFSMGIRDANVSFLLALVLVYGSMGTYESKEFNDEVSNNDML